MEQTLVSPCHKNEILCARVHECACMCACVCVLLLDFSIRWVHRCRPRPQRSLEPFVCSNVPWRSHGRGAVRSHHVHPHPRERHTTKSKPAAESPALPAGWWTCHDSSNSEFANWPIGATSWATAVTRTRPHMSHPTLSTSTRSSSDMALRVRLATSSDADRCAAIYRPAVETSPASFETEAPTEEDMAGRISSTLQTHPWLVAGEWTGPLGHKVTRRAMSMGTCTCAW